MDFFDIAMGIFFVCAVICFIGTFISGLKSDEHLEILFATLTIMSMMSMFAVIARKFLEMIE